MKKFVTYSTIALASLLSFKSNAQQIKTGQHEPGLKNLVTHNLQHVKGGPTEYINKTIGKGKTVAISMMGSDLEAKDASSNEYIVSMSGTDANNNHSLDPNEVVKGDIQTYTMGADSNTIDKHYIFEKSAGEYKLFSAVMKEGEVIKDGDATMTEQIPVKGNEMGSYKTVEEVLKAVGKDSQQPPVVAYSAPGPSI